MANKSAGFTVADECDHFGGYFVTTISGGTVIATLPAAGSTNKGQTVPFIKVDATTGVVKVTVAGGGHLGGVWDDLYLINQGDSLTAISDGTLWQVKGVVQPVAGEPSLGESHYRYTFLTSTVPGNNNVQTIATGCPAGTKAIEGTFGIAAVASKELRIIDTDGAQIVDRVIAQVAAVTASNYGHFKARIDSNGLLRWATSDYLSTAAIGIAMTFYYD